MFADCSGGPGDRGLINSEEFGNRLTSWDKSPLIIPLALNRRPSFSRLKTTDDPTAVESFFGLQWKNTNHDASTSHQNEHARPAISGQKSAGLLRVLRGPRVF